MKRTTIMKYTLAALLPMMAACQDEWDEHYGRTNPLASPESLWEAMKADANLSNFVQLAENTGYNYQFNGDQMFTVFAPTNDCLSLSDIDSLTAAYNEQKARKIKDNDNSIIKQFLQNHIAMYNQSALPTGDSVQMTMLNGKYGYLADGTINGVECLTSNQLYRNGILFTVGDKLPFFANVSESFGIDNELDSVAAFFDKFNVYEFNASQSVPGEIVDGKTVYLDSVMNLSNVMFNELGLINREDSNYWMVVPVDKEWKRLYEEYRTYYNYDNTVPKRDSMQDIMAHKAILQGAIFNMNQQPSPQDSLLSTTYSKWNYRYYKCLSPYAPGGVLDGVSETTCSNGRMFKTDQWNIDKRTTFFQEIKIEAENSFYQDSVAKCKEPVSIRSVATTNPFYGKVSGNSFVEIEPLNIIVTPLIRYTIPNVLSNIGYDIYAVFAPATAADTLATDTLPLRVEFSIQYNDQDGRLVNPIDMVNDEGSKVYETRPNVVDTILVASDYKIPTCSYNTNEPQVRLTVEANRGSAKQYTRTLRLDCIILKPHEEDETGIPNE